MFKDMGELPAALYDTLVQAARSYFSAAIPDGRYVAWVAELHERPGEIVGGAGLQLRDLLPRPHPAGQRLMRGPQGLILNVFTERRWRRQRISAPPMPQLLLSTPAHRIHSIL